MAGIERVVEFVLAATPAPATQDDHQGDLVMLGTLADGRTFWPCHLWGGEGQRSDFVHVARSCRAVADGS